VFRDTEEINSLLIALQAAQAGYLPHLVKNKVAKGKSFNFRYIDFREIIEATITPLQENNLVWFQVEKVADDGTRFLQTVLQHTESQQRIVSTFPLPSNWKNMQEMGGMLTYSRRYELSTILGIAADDDLDDTAREKGFKETSARTSNGKTPPAGVVVWNHDMIPPRADSAPENKWAQWGIVASQMISAAPNNIELSLWRGNNDANINAMRDYDERYAGKITAHIERKQEELTQ
jgi:hypothetical protein